MTRVYLACLTSSVIALLPLTGCDDDGSPDEGALGADSGLDPSEMNEPDASDGRDGPDGPDGPDGGTPELTVTPRDKPPASAFEEFMAYDWELEPGQENYYCVYKTITEDTWFTDFEPIQPEGTHHVSIGRISSGPDDGVVVAADDEDAEYPCNGLSLGDVVLYGAVLNSPGFTLPEGVATRLPAGEKIILSVHVFNGTDEPLSGHTGIAVVEADPSEVVHEAEYVLGGTFDIHVEPGISKAKGTCTMVADGTLLSLTHHMHLAGVHAKSTLVRKNGDRELLLDKPFDFYNQGTDLLDPVVHVKEGDALEVECDYDNPTTTTLTFGESTGVNEMCFSMFYRFPAVSETFFCIH